MPRRAQIPRKAKYAPTMTRTTDRFVVKLMMDGKKGLAERILRQALARAEARLIEQAEHDWNRRVVIFVVAFAWLLTIASWPVFHFVSGRSGSLLGPQFSHSWISFAAFTALGWLAGGVAAVMLGIQQRGERRLV